MKQSINSNVPLKLAAVQMNCGPDPSDNLKKTIGQLEASARNGASIVCLQEMFNTLYLCQSEDHSNFELAESIPGPTVDALCKAAKDHQVVIVAGIFERRAAGIYHNTAVVIENDGHLVGTYRKMHIPDDPSYFEKFYFTPGDLGFKVFDTSVGKVGVCICWDQWFPEAARLTALKGAEILVFPTAIGWLAEDKFEHGKDQLSAWQTMMRSHAIANGLFVITPNRVGVEDQIQFWGNSFICDPYGKIVANACGHSAETIVAECDLRLIEQARTHWPFLRDRRIDAYQDLTRRWIDE